MNPFPAETETHVDVPTRTGAVRCVVVPSPTWPEPLFPQHHSEPSVCSPQVWSKPAAT